MSKNYKNLQPSLFLLILSKFKINFYYMLEKIDNLSNIFFKNLWINIEQLEIVEEKENIFYIKIKTPDSWILIWQNWKNLISISNLLKLMINKNTVQKVKIYFEVNDYLESKDERLKSLILEKIKYVEKTWSDLKLWFYSPYQRKKIHDIVSEYENNEIYTKSLWEWEERRIYICRKNPKMTIDIDGYDI